jgi:hypothetical protein
LLIFRKLGDVVSGLLLAIVLAIFFVGLGNAFGLPEAVLKIGLAAIIVGVPVAVYWRLQTVSRQEQELALTEQGFAPSTVSDEDLRRELRTFPTFSMRARGRVRNHLTTERHGVDVSIFDFSFTGETRIPTIIWLLVLLTPRAFWLMPRYRKQTVVKCRSGGVILPQFFLRLRKAVTADGVFEAELGDEVLMPPDFFRRYSLRAVDPERVRGVFSPAAVEFFREHAELNAEGAGDTLLVYRPGRLARGDELVSLVEEALSAYELICGAAAPSSGTKG